MPTTTSFPELNVRTYVEVDGKPGVYFLSLDATSWLSVRAARAWYLLPYVDARMRWWPEDGWIRFESARSGEDAVWRGRYRPLPDAPIRQAAPGSFEHWLTERYALYTVDRRRRVYRADVHHAPWPVQDAQVEIERNTLGAVHGLDLAGERPDHVLCASRVDTVAWRPRQVVP